MRIYLVRHAVAIDAEDTKLPDSARFLTKEGRRRFVRAARRFARAPKPPRILVTSPLVRAVQTAELLADALEHDREIDVWKELGEHGPLAAILKRLATFEDDARVALVGHEPQLGQLAEALCGAPLPRSFPKGGVAAIVAPRAKLRGAGELRYLFVPKGARFVDAGGEPCEPR